MRKGGSSQESLRIVFFIFGFPKSSFSLFFSLDCYWFPQGFLVFVLFSKFFFAANYSVFFVIVLCLFFVVLIVFVRSCLQIQKTQNPGPMATPSVLFVESRQNLDIVRTSKLMKTLTRKSKDFIIPTSDMDLSIFQATLWC